MENQDNLHERRDQGGRKLPVLSPGDRVWVCNHDTEGIVKQEVEPSYFEVTTSNGTYTVCQCNLWSHALIKLCTVNSVIQRKLWYTQIGQGLQKLCVPKAGRNHILNVLRMREYTHFQYPFSVPDPTQLAHPVRVVTGLTYPCGIAFNSRREMIVSERESHRIVVLDIKGDIIRTFGSEGYSPEEMMYPESIAVDGMDNIYVSSSTKLQKFTRSGELMKWIGMGKPRGVTLYNNEVYVCDTCNNQIQVFDLDFNYIRSIGNELDTPHDVKFDTDGYMYVAEFGNQRVQVLNRSGHFIRVFGEGEFFPVALHIVDNCVYVSGRESIAVYRTSGQFVTSFGSYVTTFGSLYINPTYSCITSCHDGFIHVCDFFNSDFLNIICHLMHKMYH